MKKKTTTQYRQGDVLLERVGDLPRGALPRPRDERGRVVLAYGEATGHAHAIAEAEALLYDLGDELFLQADGTVTLRHEEHSAITVDKGTYRVVRQSEYHPEIVRTVLD